MDLRRCRPDVVLEARDGTGRGGLLPGTDALGTGVAASVPEADQLVCYIGTSRMLP